MQLERWMFLGMIAAGFQVAGCTAKQAQAATPTKTAPAKIEKIEGSDLKLVTLTPKAMERVGVKTAPVSALAKAPPRAADARKGTVVPYAAVLYDAKGGTWVYTSPKPMTFVRHRIQVASIEGEQAMLTDGPPAGTEVVVVGASVIYGAETGIGK